MKPSIFDFEEARVKEEVRKHNAKRVLIQLPEGLKPQGPRLAEAVEETGAQVIVSADPCYGACDLALEEADDLNVDLVIHFGHSSMHRGKHERVSVVYIETKATLRLETAVKKALPLLKAWKRIGLVTTVQHVDQLDEAERMLLKAGKSVAVGDAGRLKYAGQVIGCDYSNADAVAEDVDCFLFAGGGRFHAIGVALATSKPVVVADPYEERAYSVDSEAERIRKQRWASIRAAVHGERVGILVGLKSGQRRLEKALQISNRLKKAGKKSYLLAIREVTPESLREFPTLDAYVNTACPRISLDDASRFHKPVLTVNEALVVAGEITWEQLLRKGWFED
ncbi:MAG TPA: diphthamide biosynthesis enzyme Dph2 [Candidatus Bathyarchaeia archaeon]|nr:diphthamide biosynthesis enzyme Dph2 [Candidatus Bathyarchaeia archaeon]